MIPTTIASYLDALRAALKGAPAGLIADALADAEDHFRGARAANPNVSEAELVASYGTPEDVAAEYRDSESPAALPFAAPAALVPMAEQTRKPYPGLFGVLRDPVTYGALLYMLLSLATGIFYFTWAVTGLSLSFGFLILIIGIPFFMLFVGSIRILAHVEGRIVEALLGVRMPRRLPASQLHLSFWARIGDMVKDPRTWSSIAYMLLMLPLGIVYFVCAVVGLSVSLSLVAAGLWNIVTWGHGDDFWFGGNNIHGRFASLPWLHSPDGGVFCIMVGVMLFFGLLHLARGIGWLHGRIAEHLLVRL